MASQNPIQDKVNELVEERTKLHTQLSELQNQVEQCKTRIVEINGSIKVLVELFSKPAAEQSITNEVGVVRHDSENKAGSGADSNEG